jgi:hypothetical protein
MRFVTFIFVSFFSACAVAQQRGASDLELSVAYCIASQLAMRMELRKQLDKIIESDQLIENEHGRAIVGRDFECRGEGCRVVASRRWDKWFQDSLQGTEAVFRTALEESDKKIYRLKAYLSAKGVGIWRESTPFLIATHRGEADHQECKRLAQSMCGNKCDASCDFHSAGDSKTCASCQNTCDPPDACKRGRNCEAVLTQLPW